MGFERKTVKKADAMEVSTIAAEGLSDWQLYKQFGNSVVVQTVEIIFKLIKRHFFPKKKVKVSLSK
jgi:site-specific DNA-cytosine methylase